jgi:acetolactate decarboxylase
MSAADISIQEAITRALRQYLQADSTLYQVSTSTALVEGVYKGAVDIRTLKEHGDLGLGTFEDLDGEMIVINGHFFRAKSDGSVEEASDDVLTPFAVVTRFKSDRVSRVHDIKTQDDFLKSLDSLRNSNNVFYAFRVSGFFDRISTRAMCKTEGGVKLVEAAAHQPEFHFKNVEGTLVGFWSPEYAGSVDIPGYHFHFLSADRSKGGHVLDLSGKEFQVEVQKEGTLVLALPETKDFLEADLSHNPSAALDKAEKEQRK